MARRGVDRERFSTTYLREGWQLVPWDILSSDPVRSVWYLHIQPPGWNLVLGLVGWMTPASEAFALQLLMAAFGVAGAALAAVLASRLGLGRVAAAMVAVVATIHPEVLLLASKPTYELPVAVLLLAIAVAATFADARPAERSWRSR